MSGILSNFAQSPPSGAPVTRCAARWLGLELRVKSQDIGRLTTWSITDPRHTVILHLDGPIHHLETELAGTGALADPPMPGEVWVVPGQTRYSSLARGQVVRYAELFLDSEALDGCRAPSIRPLAGHYDRFLHTAAERLIHLASRPGDLAQLAAHALSQTLYFHFFLQYGAAPTAIRRRPPRRIHPSAQKSLSDYIDAHLGQPITLTRLAAIAGLTPHALLPAFRTCFGTTPAQYIIEQRLRRARWLLRTTAADITRIALDTGFASHAHLSATFRARLGISPKEFRATGA